MYEAVNIHPDVVEQLRGEDMAAKAAAEAVASAPFTNKNKPAAAAGPPLPPLPAAAGGGTDGSPAAEPGSGSGEIAAPPAVEPPIQQSPGTQSQEPALPNMAVQPAEPHSGQSVADGAALLADAGPLPPPSDNNMGAAPMESDDIQAAEGHAAATGDALLGSEPLLLPVIAPPAPPSATPRASGGSTATAETPTTKFFNTQLDPLLQVSACRRWRSQTHHMS